MENRRNLLWCLQDYGLCFDTVCKIPADSPWFLCENVLRTASRTNYWSISVGLRGNFEKSSREVGLFRWKTREIYCDAYKTIAYVSTPCAKYPPTAPNFFAKTWSGQPLEPTYGVSPSAFGEILSKVREKLADFHGKSVKSTVMLTRLWLMFRYRVQNTRRQPLIFLRKCAQDSL